MGKQTKRPPKADKSATKTLRQQLQNQGLFKDDLMRLEETEEPKLAPVMLDLMTPYLRTVTTRAAFEQLATVAVVAWNAAQLAGEEERAALMAAAVKAIVAAAGEQWRKDTADVMQALMERKLSQFAADRRYIVDFRVTETATDYHLAVATMARRGSEGEGDAGMDVATDVATDG